MLVVIDPGVHTPEKECWEWIQAESSLAIGVHLPAIEGWTSLDAINLESVQGVIILGSGASPTDPTLEWQFHLKRWLKDYMTLNKPLLGICYGHQLLAHMYGGNIHFLSDLDNESYPPDAKESGLRSLWFTPQEHAHLALFSDKEIPNQTQVEWIVSHREVVSSLPIGWIKCGLSSISHLGVELMKHQQAPWWGVQAHIEAVDAFLVNNQVSLASLPTPYQGHEFLRAFLKKCEAQE